MEILWSSVDLTRIIFLLGAVLALLYKKKFGVTPGGIIVPGTLAILLFSSFATFLVVLALAAICWVAYKYTFGRYALTRRWSSLILVSMSVLLGLIATAIISSVQLLSEQMVLLSLITPGLIAIGARRYHPARVVLGTLTVTAVCYLAGWALVLTLPFEMLTYLTVQLGTYTQLSIDNPYVIFPISLITAILVYYRFGIRGGGYLVAPFLATVTFSSPLQALLLVLSVALSYIAVRLALKYTLIIGLERFVFSLFCGYIFVTAIDLLAINFMIPGYRPAPIVLIILIAVMTNDLSLQPLKASLKNGFSPALLMSHLTKWAA